MRTRAFICFALIATSLLFAFGCVKLDSFLFDSEPASLEDYDFNTEDLDGIPIDRISSIMIPSGGSGEKIHAIYVKRDQSELDPRLDPTDRITVLFSHGNRANMLLYWYRVGYFEDMGFNVMIYDYRGYGASDGETTETNLKEDVEAAYDYLRARDDVGAIFPVGYSLGGAPTIWLCSPKSEREVTGCYTEAAFASTEKLLQDGTDYSFPSSWYIDAKLDNESTISSVEVPFMIAHGTEDQRVSFENGEMLWSAVRENNALNRFFPIKGATHRNVPVPSYPGSEEPREYSHPDEMPPNLRDEFQEYKSRIVEFVVDAMNQD